MVVSGTPLIDEISQADKIIKSTWLEYIKYEISVEHASGHCCLEEIHGLSFKYMIWELKALILPVK